MSFFDKLIEKVDPLSIDTLNMMEKMYSISKYHNAEVKFRWCMLNLQSKNEAIFPEAVDFMTSIGRARYVAPLYRAMIRCSENGKTTALKAYEDNKGFYHPITRQSIERELKLSSLL